MTASRTQNDPQAAVTSVNKRFMEAVRARDTAAMADCYTRDGEVLAPGADAVRGKDSISMFWKNALSAGIGSVELQTVDAEPTGDRIIETGRFRLQGTDGSELDHGKYLVVWKQEAGDWKIHRDMFNSSVPQAG